MKTLFLSMHGTDVRQAHQSDADAYPRGETVGIIHDAITASENLTKTSIDGPNTFATNVGEKMFQAIAAIDSAFPENSNTGEIFTVNVLGFSRGAVQSILVTHVIETLFVLAKNRTCPGGFFREPTGYAKYFTEEQQNTLTNLWKKFYKFVHQKEPPANATDEHNASSLNDTDVSTTESSLVEIGGTETCPINFNLFLIDPVPGDKVWGIPRTEWADHFYTIPTIVSNCTQLIAQHETTAAFTAIRLDTNNEKTDLSIQSMPGHHGSMGGNANTQQGVDVSDGKTCRLLETNENFPITVLPQVVTLYLLVEWAMQLNMPLDIESIIDQHRHRAALLTVMRVYQQLNKHARDTARLELYALMRENEAIFSRFSQTGYPYLNRDSERRIRTKEPSNVLFMHEIHKQSVFFINRDHESLFQQAQAKAQRQLEEEASPAPETIVTSEGEEETATPTSSETTIFELTEDTTIDNSVSVISRKRASSAPAKLLLSAQLLSSNEEITQTVPLYDRPPTSAIQVSRQRTRRYDESPEIQPAPLPSPPEHAANETGNRSSVPRYILNQNPELRMPGNAKLTDYLKNLKIDQVLSISSYSAFRNEDSKRYYRALLDEKLARIHTATIQYLQSGNGKKRPSCLNFFKSTSGHCKAWALRSAIETAFSVSNHNHTAIHDADYLKIQKLTNRLLKDSHHNRGSFSRYYVAAIKGVKVDAVQHKAKNDGYSKSDFKRNRPSIWL